MTSIPSGSNDSLYPATWHSIDAISGVEARQTTLDTWELRSASHTITVNSEGFDLYRHDLKKFEDWCDEHGIQAVPRDDKSWEDINVES